MKYKLNDVLTKPTGDVKCGDKALPALSCTQHEGLVLQSDKYTKQIASEDMSNYWIVHPQQLVTTFHMDKGVLAIWNGTHDGAVSPAYKVWDVNTAIVLPAYLELAMKAPASIRYYLQFAKTTVAGRCAINDKDLLDMPIEIPDMAQQQRVLDILNALEKALQQCQHRIALHDELVKSRFIELFGDPVANPMGWKTRRFDSLCENLDYRRKPITASEREAGIYPYYGASGIVDYVADYLFDEDILLVSEDGANLLMRSTPIAFSVRGKVWVNNHAHVVRFEKMSMQKYIEVFFSLIDISDHITGSAQPKLNQAKLNAMMFPVPDDNRLEAFLSFVEQTDKSKLAIQQSLDKLELLKKSLMQEYFG